MLTASQPLDASPPILGFLAAECGDYSSPAEVHRGINRLIPELREQKTRDVSSKIETESRGRRNT
jgi:hypothetical protein